MLTCENGETFDIEDGILLSYSGTERKVVIPDEVIVIKEGLFRGNSNVESVVIPSGITRIGNGVFYNCVNLKNVVMSDSITEIGKEAFYGCISLRGIRLSEGLLDIADGAFEHTGLERIVIPDSIRHISDRAFAHCYDLQTVEIGRGLRGINKFTFFESNNITEISLGMCLLNSINLGAFSSKALKSIDVAKENPRLASIDGVLFSKDKRVLLRCPSGREGKYAVPEGVEKIVPLAFSGCSKLTKIKLPDSIMEVGVFAFRGCNAKIEESSKH